MAKILPGVSPLGPKFQNFVLGSLHEGTCAVAPNQLGGASVGEFDKVELGEGDAFCNLLPVY